MKHQGVHHSLLGRVPTCFLLQNRLKSTQEKAWKIQEKTSSKNSVRPLQASVLGVEKENFGEILQFYPVSGKK